MQDLNDKVTGSTLTAAEWNEPMSELQNIIEGLTQVLTSADLNQLFKSIASMAGCGDFYAESGVADQYIATVISTKQGPVALNATHDGMRVRFRPGNANTGASTINVATLGVRDILREDGSALQANDLLTTRDTELRYDYNSGTDRFLLVTPFIPGQVEVSRGYIDGFITSNNGADPAKDIDFAPGICRDQADSETMQTSAITTKQIDANWVAGTNNGGFPSALTLTADTWYHLFVIKNSGTGAVDFGFDSDIDAINLLSDATGFDKGRLIGSVRMDATLDILPYTQRGDSFTWTDAGYQDINMNPGATEETHSLKFVPFGIRTEADVVVLFFTDTGLGTSYYVVTGGDETITTSPGTNYADARSEGDGRSASVAKHVWTNLVGQVKTQTNNANATALRIQTHGWRFNRGKE